LCDWDFQFGRKVDFFCNCSLKGYFQFLEGLILGIWNFGLCCGAWQIHFFPDLAGHLKRLGSWFPGEGSWNHFQIDHGEQTFQNSNNLEIDFWLQQNFWKFQNQNQNWNYKIRIGIANLSQGRRRNPECHIPMHFGSQTEFLHNFLSGDLSGSSWSPQCLGW